MIIQPLKIGFPASCQSSIGVIYEGSIASFSSCHYPILHAFKLWPTSNTSKLRNVFTKDGLMSKQDASPSNLNN